MTADLGRAPNLTKHDARQRLEHERNCRLAQLRAIEESAPHADKDLQEAQTAAIERVLKEIDAARERLADGPYGTCKSCRSFIPVERLEILPYVRFCVGCQQRVS
ncbi:TraR/DksA C4-type zinc finger protein [Kribbella sp. NBC_01484]|uniref:TraR/DksA family transcriptional regulator n=1 Tax=Kribbella sp. NBC_01484 TaxID=2903579 RepID=UPI002E3103BF|nr:TraR/DksA C4-type zinc finger protein [Kribbella sp. NBC_01484]